jgi:nucleotide-binding universal stress UspA family protein
MASHGRSGFVKLLLGSVTQKVLVASELPVLVIKHQGD